MNLSLNTYYRSIWCLSSHIHYYYSLSLPIHGWIKKFWNYLHISLNIVAAFRGLHVSPAKHRCAWLPRKCDYRTDTLTDAGQSDPCVPLCFAGDTNNRHKLNQMILNLYRVLSYHFLISQWCLNDAVHTQICNVIIWWRHATGNRRKIWLIFFSEKRTIINIYASLSDYCF